MVVPRSKYYAVPKGLAAAGRRRRPYASVLAPEKKFYDTNLNVTTIAAATDATGGEYDPSATSMISTPATGDGEQNRDGKKIVIEALSFNAALTLNAEVNQATADAPTDIFLALVLDTQSNQAQMNSEDCFKNLNAQSATNPIPMRNLLFGSRFRVLKEWNIKLKPPTLSYDGTNLEQGGDSRLIQYWQRFPGGLVVNFNAGTTASIANVIDNSIHVIAYANTATATLAYNARIRFCG